MSITYRLFLVLLLTGPTGQVLAQSQTERHYRIELIVLRHLDGVSDSAPQETLRDLTELLDLYAPPVEGNDLKAKIPLEPASTDESMGVETLDGEALLEPEPPMAVRVDELSDTMREAWRRLRLSAGFRPEQFRSWEQSGNGPFPTLRFHDEEILFEIDPAMQPVIGPVDEFGALVFSDETMDSQIVSDLDSSTGEEIAEEEEELPPIQYFYRIDGSAELSRSRFLHLDVDIELREPLYESLHESLPDSQNENPSVQSIIAPNPEMIRTTEALTATEPLEQAQVKTGPAADATAFRVHRIKQRRQVKTEQIEYFDGPVIGVLAFITGFDVVPEDISP